MGWKECRFLSLWKLKPVFQEFTQLVASFEQKISQNLFSVEMSSAFADS